MNNKIIAVYSRQAYPSSMLSAYFNSFTASPVNTILICSPNADSNSNIVYNQIPYLMFDLNGNYIGDQNWGYELTNLRLNAGIQNIIFSINDSTIPLLAQMTETAAFNYVMLGLSRLGINGIDFDCETLQPNNLDVMKVTYALINFNQNNPKNKLLITAAPYTNKELWKSWIATIKSSGGEVAWLNVQSYGDADIVDWANDFPDISIVAGFEAYMNPDQGLTPDNAKTQLSTWKNGCTKNNLVGAYVWDFGIIITSPFSLNEYANQMNEGL